MAKDSNNPENKSKGGAPKGEGRQAEGKAPKGDAKGSKAPKGKAADSAEPADLGPKVPPRLKVMFDEKVRPQLAEKFGLKNPMEQPRLQKVVLNVNMGRHLEGTKLPPHVRATVLETLVKVSGQKPVVVKAKKSVSNFKLREGFESSAVVTLRRERMWWFLDRLFNLATPRIKDFRGLPTEAFDRQGNYSMGLTEQGVFPEINMADATFTHGMHINMCFSGSNKELSRFVLEQLGLPFKKPETK
jgi:large subunit ribosomal protein L5